METIEIHEEFFNRVKTWCAFGRGVLESTLKESRTYLEKIIEKWGSFDIRDIKVSDVGNYLFMHENKPLRKEYLETIFRKALEKAGIDLDGRKLTPHSLRYTYVTKMRRTLPVDTVRKLVGHTAEKMTEYYTRASIEDGLAGIKDTKTAVENLFD